MLTILEIIKKTTDFFAQKGVESPRLNAELLIGHALGLKRMALYLQFERPLAEAELEKIRPLVRRRAQREPLQYILGETDFRGLRVKVDRRALIPRPETELLVEHAIAEAKEQLLEEKRIADKKSLEALTPKSKSKSGKTSGPMQLKSPAKTSPTKMKKC